MGFATGEGCHCEGGIDVFLVDEFGVFVFFRFDYEVAFFVAVF